MRIFYSTDFTGHYPVGSAAIVIAENIEEASLLIDRKLNEQDLKFDGNLTEILFEDNPQAIILCNGDY